MKMKYAIQRTDAKTGKRGDFGYTRNANNEIEAITPVFSDLMELYDYCNQNDIELDHSV